jgi:hypothetical protein
VVGEERKERLETGDALSKLAMDLRKEGKELVENESQERLCTEETMLQLLE